MKGTRQTNLTGLKYHRPDKYTEAPLKHAEKYLRNFKERVTWRRKLKLTDFLLRQGYEYNTIKDALKAHEELK